MNSSQYFISPAEYWQSIFVKRLIKRFMVRNWMAKSKKNIVGMKKTTNVKYIQENNI